MRPGNRRSGTGEGIMWLALGAVVGAGAALLLAPQRGVHTRRRLAESSGEMFDRGRELFEKGREIAQETAEMFERGKKMAEQHFDEQYIERELEHYFNQGK